MTSNTESASLKTYYAVCNAGGPISVRIEAEDVDAAVAQFAATNKRSWIDNAATDAEDDIIEIDATNMSEDEFADALTERGCTMVRDLDSICNAHAGTIAHLSGGWSLWAAPEGEPEGELCECGCGERAERTVELLREQDRGTAEALGWAESSVGPMRVHVWLVDGHDIPDGYVDEDASEELCDHPRLAEDGSCAECGATCSLLDVTDYGVCTDSTCPLHGNPD